LGDGDGNVESAWNGNNGDNGRENLGPAVNFKRTDWAALLGYLIPHKWEKYGDLGIFAGYKSGNSKVNFNQYFNNVRQETIDYNYDLVSGGPFIGVGTGVRVGKYGIFGVRVAYAWLYTDVSQKTNFSGTNTFTGNGSGISVGGSWVGSLTQKIQYTLGVDWHNYNYNDLEDSKDNKHVGIVESQVSGRVGVTYIFR